LAITCSELENGLKVVVILRHLYNSLIFNELVEDRDEELVFFPKEKKVSNQ
jgi:hypothetical protein